MNIKKRNHQLDSHVQSLPLDLRGGTVYVGIHVSKEIIVSEMNTEKFATTFLTLEKLNSPCNYIVTIVTSTKQLGDVLFPQWTIPHQRFNFCRKPMTLGGFVIFCKPLYRMVPVSLNIPAVRHLPKS